MALCGPATGGRLRFGLALAAAWLAAEAAGGCDLDPWLQHEAGADRGYHVLCVSGGRVDLYVDGLAGAGPSAPPLEVGAGLADALEERLQLDDLLVFKPERQPNGQGSWSGGHLAWPKQSWALFTPVGERVEPDQMGRRLQDYEGVLLLFEGGTWRWPTVRVGYERPVLEGVVLRTVSMRPALFELVFTGLDQEDAAPGEGERLGPQMLDGVTGMAETRLRRSLTEGAASKIRTSTQAWFGYGETPQLKQLQKHTVGLLHIPASHFEENLQVLNYKVGQLYDAHRDYWDPREFPDKARFLHGRTGLWNMRHCTVLWFLKAAKEGGATWFPRAHGGPIPWGEWTACDRRGELMSGRNGTIAILFYSLYSNGDIDEYSWHCGCPVKAGEKWAANSWVWNQPQVAGASQRLSLRRRRAQSRTADGKGRATEEGAGAAAPGGSGVSLSFLNEGAKEVTVLWLGDGGAAAKPMLQVQPGEEKSLNTFAGHVFRVEDGAGSVLRKVRVRADKSRQRVRIRGNEL